jgi:hypothetical protein
MTLRTPLLTTLFAAACALAIPAAQAGRPLQTEDAGVLERGSCELEGVQARLREQGISTTGQSLQVGCGIGLNTQLAVASSRSKVEGFRATGLALGGKTELWRGAGEDAAAFTLAYGVEWDKPAGEKRQRSASVLRAVFSQPVPGGSVHANLAAERDEIAKERSTSWALAYEHEGFDAGPIKLAPMAEVFGTRGESAWWNLALRATLIPEKLFVDGSYGRQSGGNKPSFVTLGFKFAF